MASFLDEICRNCGLSFGAHLGGSYYSKNYKKEFPMDCCPGHESEMDWDVGPGTVFKSTGTFKLVECGTPALNSKRRKEK